MLKGFDASVHHGFNRYKLRSQSVLILTPLFSSIPVFLFYFLSLVVSYFCLLTCTIHVNSVLKDKYYYNSMICYNYWYYSECNRYCVQTTWCKLIVIITLQEESVHIPCSYVNSCYLHNVNDWCKTPCWADVSVKYIPFSH